MSDFKFCLLPTMLLSLLSVLREAFSVQDCVASASPPLPHPWATSLYCVPGRRPAVRPLNCHTSQFHSGSHTDKSAHNNRRSLNFSKMLLNNNQMQFNSHHVHIRNPFQGKSEDALWFSVTWMTSPLPWARFRTQRRNNIENDFRLQSLNPVSGRRRI